MPNVYGVIIWGSCLGTILLPVGLFVFIIKKRPNGRFADNIRAEIRIRENPENPAPASPVSHCRTNSGETSPVGSPRAFSPSCSPAVVVM
jgi:hypothetical protein